MRGADWVAIIAALGAAIPACIAAWQSRSNGRGIADVHAEVKTANGASLAVLADAVESRRIMELLPEQRTPTEISHLVTAPGVNPPVPVPRRRIGDVEGP